MNDDFEVILRKADLLKLYAVYCSNQALVGKKIQEFSAAKPEFEAYLQVGFHCSPFVTVPSGVLIH